MHFWVSRENERECCLCAGLEALVGTRSGTFLRENVDCFTGDIGCVPERTEGRGCHYLSWIIPNFATRTWAWNDIRTISFNEVACANTGSVVTLPACYLDLLREHLSTSAFPSINTKTVQLVNTLSCLSAVPVQCTSKSVHVCACICVGVHACLCVRTAEADIRCLPPSLFILLFEMSIFAEAEAHWFGEASYLASPREPPALLSPLL